MDSADYWRLSNELSIFNAIMLALGYDPSDIRLYDINQRGQSLPIGYVQLHALFVNAVKSNSIKVAYLSEHNQDDYIDIEETLLSVETIKTFLKDKGLKEGFFFPEKTITQNYLNKDNPFFAPKLAAAIHAWEAVTNDLELQKGKTPKKALETWLRDNAKDHGLLKEDGSFNESAITEISKIANWKPEGGATKTPMGGQVTENLSPPLKSYKLKTFLEKTPLNTDLDEEIPF